MRSPTVASATSPFPKSFAEAWPSTGIIHPGDNDVLFGRGGGPNNHIGNVRFRKLVSEYKDKYFTATKANKPKVAREVVKLWRSQNPPGRFLIKANSYVTWSEVGEKKAQEKTSQCLREKYAYDKPIPTPGSSTNNSLAESSFNAPRAAISAFTASSPSCSSSSSSSSSSQSSTDKQPFIPPANLIPSSSEIAIDQISKEAASAGILSNTDLKLKEESDQEDDNVSLSSSSSSEDDEEERLERQLRQQQYNSSGPPPTLSLELQQSLMTLQQTNVEVQQVFKAIMQPNLSREQYNYNLNSIHMLQQKQLELLKKLYPHVSLEDLNF